jgi:hypothetical protein
MKISEKQLKKFEKRGEEIITGRKDLTDKKERKEAKNFDRQTEKER